MKKMMMMLIMATVALTASAQNTLRETGAFTLQPKVGIGLGHISGSYDGDFDPKFRAGFVGGLEGECYAAPWLGIALGVNYAQQGWKMKSKSLNTTVTNKLDYLNIPLVANFYVVRGLALKAGVQLGILLKAKTEDVDVKDICKSTAFAIPVGISYEFSNVVLDFRYNIGASKVNKEGDAQRGDLLQLTVGYKFEL